MSAFTSFLYSLVSFFGLRKAEPIEKKPLPGVTSPLPESSTEPTPEPISIPSSPETGLIDWIDWTIRAAKIVGTFEGKGEDWGNPVGNFDGAGLTCGLLGFTWKYNNQPPMILKFVDRHGINALRALMPFTGEAYYKAARAGESPGMSIVKEWTNKSNKSLVNEPYRRELSAFWTSPGMIQIQREKAWEMMGIWAKKMTLEAQQYFNLPAPKFEHFVFFVDQATLNGTGKTPTFQAAAAVQLMDVLHFCDTVGGFNVPDIRKNAKLWRAMLAKSPLDETVLFKFGYLRALKANSKFRATTFNRRGTLALGSGYVNGTLRHYEWE